MTTAAKTTINSKRDQKTHFFKYSKTTIYCAVDGSTTFRKNYYVFREICDFIKL